MALWCCGNSTRRYGILSRWYCMRFQLTFLRLSVIRPEPAWLVSALAGRQARISGVWLSCDLKMLQSPPRTASFPVPASGAWPASPCARPPRRLTVPPFATAPWPVAGQPRPAPRRSGVSAKRRTLRRSLPSGAPAREPERRLPAGFGLWEPAQPVTDRRSVRSNSEVPDVDFRLGNSLDEAAVAQRVPPVRGGQPGSAMQGMRISQGRAPFCLNRLWAFSPAWRQAAIALSQIPLSPASMPDLTMEWKTGEWDEKMGQFGTRASSPAWRQSAIALSQIPLLPAFLSELTMGWKTGEWEAIALVSFAPPSMGRVDENPSCANSIRPFLGIPLARPTASSPVKGQGRRFLPNEPIPIRLPVKLSQTQSNQIKVDQTCSSFRSREYGFLRCPGHPWNSRNRNPAPFLRP